MLTLDTLNVMLAVSEEGLIEEMIIALLASPQLAVFFEKFPRLKAAITDDVPRWREALRSRLKDARVPPELTEDESACGHITLPDCCLLPAARWRPPPAGASGFFLRVHRYGTGAR